jgi:hypothetical protein
MANWLFIGDLLCQFCRTRIESREKFFLYCSFPRRIWSAILRRCLCMTEGWDAGKLKFSVSQISFMVVISEAPLLG